MLLHKCFKSFFFLLQNTQDTIYYTWYIIYTDWIKLLDFKIFSRDRYKILQIKYGHITLQKQFVIGYLFILF